MQIAPIGALEVALSNMSTGINLQQQVAAGSSTRPGNGWPTGATTSTPATSSGTPICEGSRLVSAS